MILTLHNLEKAGLLKRSEGRGQFPALRKQLQLVDDDVNEQNPTDISYVFSGFSPMSVRLVQHAANGTWNSLEEVLRLLPGPAFVAKQQLSPTVATHSGKINLCSLLVLV